MLALVSQMSPVLEQIKEYDQEIWRLFESHPDSEAFNSLPGAGKQLAPRLLVVLGRRPRALRFRSQCSSIGGYFPRCLPERKLPKDPQAVRLRQDFPQHALPICLQSRLREPWALEYYQRKRAEGKSHSVATRTLAIIWVRIVHAVWAQSWTLRRFHFPCGQAGSNARKAA